MGKSGNNAPPDTDMTRMSGPWMPLQKPTEGLINDLSSFYKNGDPYKVGPRVTQPFTDAQKQAMTGQLNVVRGGTGQQGSADYYNHLAQMSGTTAADMPGQDFFGGLANGSSPYGQAFQNIYNNVAGGGAGQTGIDSASKFATGGYMGSNPYLDAMYGQGADALKDQFQQTTNPTIEGLLTRTGGGSGSSVEAELKGQAQKQLGGALGDLSTKIYGGAYDQDMSRMLGAAQSLPGMQATTTNTQLGAAGANLGSAAQGVAGLQQNQGNAFTQAMGAGNSMGAAYQNQFAPWQMMGQVGNEQQQQATTSAQEQAQRFQYTQDAPYQQMMRYMQGLQGASGMAPNAGAVGSQYAQNVMNQPSSGQMAIGNLTGLLGAASPIIGMGAGGYFAGQAMQQMMQPQQQATPYGMNWSGW